jgi:hypothetical protein
MKIVASGRIKVATRPIWATHDRSPADRFFSIASSSSASPLVTKDLNATQ